MQPTVSDKRIIVYPAYFNPSTLSMEFFEPPAPAPTPEFAAIAASASGATTIVQARSGRKIRVVNVVLISNGTVNVKWQSSASAIDLTGLAYLVANTGFAPGYDPTGHFETSVGQALDINLSGSVAVGGWLKYVLV